MALGKGRTEEELKAARARKVIEYAALPDRSMFGNDNHAAERVLMDTFDKLIAGANPDALQGTLYDMADVSSTMYDTVSGAISLCDWASGWKDESFEAKEG